METLIQQLPYVGVVGVLLLSGLGLPIPEDVPLLWGGYMCGIGRANIWVMVPLALGAVLVADYLVFGMGRLFGLQVARLPLFRRFLSPERLDKAAIKLHAHSGKTLFTARFLPGLRMPIYFTAGTFRIPFWKMLVFDGVAAAISVPAWVLTAYFFAPHFDRLLELSRDVQMILGGVVVALIAAFLIYRHLRKTRKAREEVGDAASGQDLPSSTEPVEKGLAEDRAA